MNIHGRDMMRATVSLILLTAYNAVLGALFKWQVPQGNKEIIVYMIGQLSGMVTTALAFYFATTKSSADKNKLIDRLSDGTDKEPEQ